MRFFNAGVEVAHDGSPVPTTANASPPPTRRLARFSTGRLAFPTSDHRDNYAADDDDAGTAAFGATGAGEVCGLPSFSLGGGRLPGGGDRRPRSAPSDLVAEGEAHIDPHLSNR